MNIWEVLGIEYTTDKNELKKAYRRKLAVTNPEDNQEGFMQLREAYEVALKLADGKAFVINRDESYATTQDKETVNDETVNDETVNKETANNETINENDSNSDSELHKFKHIERRRNINKPQTTESIVLEELKNIYNTYSRRINPDEWKKLFEREEFVSLDTAEKSFGVLMHFLMAKFFVPKCVWKVIVDTFDIAARRLELYEQYPEKFIEFMINNSTFDDVLAYELVEGDEEQVDEFHNKYHKLDLAIRNRNLKVQEEYIEDIEKMPISHPYFEVLRIKHLIQKINADSESGELTEEKKSIYENCLEKLKVLNEKYREDSFLLMMYGDILMLLEKNEEAGEAYEKALEIAPDSYIAKGKLADQRFAVGKYEESRELFLQLLRINNYDNNVRAGMMRANAVLIEEYKKTIRGDIGNKKARMELSWCYYQNYKFNDAINVLNGFEPDEADICEYNNLKGRVYLCLMNYKDALECFLVWKNAIEKIAKSDKSKESKKIIKRYEYVNFLIGDCYLRLKDYRNARYYMDIALSKEHDEIILAYEGMCMLEFKEGNYRDCIEYCKRVIERVGRNYVAYIYQARSYYELGMFDDALAVASNAIELYPYAAEPYVIKIKTYINLRMENKVLEVINEYRQINPDSDSMMYYEAKLKGLHGKYADAIALLDKLLEKHNPNKTDMETPMKIFGLKAEYLTYLKNYDKALYNYDIIIANDPDNPVAYGKKSLLYEIKDDYNNAIIMIEKQLRIAPSPFYYFKSGIYNFRVLRRDRAIEHFEMCLAKDRKREFYILCCRNLSQLYYYRDDFEKAIKCATMVVDNTGDIEEKKKFQLEVARYYQGYGKFDVSKKLYESYINNYGISSKAVYYYSILLYRMGYVEDAISILQKTINRVAYDDYLQRCIRNLCRIYGDEGNIDKAKEIFKLAIDKDEKDAQAYALMGKIYFEHKKVERAKKYYNLAVKYDTDNEHHYLVNVMEVYAASFINNGTDACGKIIQQKIPIGSHADLAQLVKFERMRNMFGKAVSKANKKDLYYKCYDCPYGTCHCLLYELGMVYEAMGKKDKALDMYREALRVYGHNPLYERKIEKLSKKKLFKK